MVKSFLSWLGFMTQDDKIILEQEIVSLKETMIRLTNYIENEHQENKKQYLDTFQQFTEISREQQAHSAELTTKLQSTQQNSTAHLTNAIDAIKTELINKIVTAQQKTTVDLKTMQQANVNGLTNILAEAKTELANRILTVQQNATDLQSVQQANIDHLTNAMESIKAELTDKIMIACQNAVTEIKTTQQAKANTLTIAIDTIKTELATKLTEQKRGLLELGNGMNGYQEAIMQTLALLQQEILTRLAQIADKEDLRQELANINEMLRLLLVNQLMEYADPSKGEVTP